MPYNKRLTTQRNMKEKYKKKIRFWAGFVDDKIATTQEYYGDRLKMPAIYIRRADANKSYEDVRLIEIKIISQ